MTGMLRLTGSLVFVIFVSSVTVFRTLHFHTGGREAAWALVKLAAFLELLWTGIAVVPTVRTWRTAGIAFRAIFLANVAVVCLLISTAIYR
jgi:hypothetical protein